MQTLPVIAVNGVIGAQVSPLDRGFTYGDGVFETCKLNNKKIPLWDLHKDRLLKSCERLLIPVTEHLIEAKLFNLLADINIADAIVKITVTRGEGGRGYRSPDSVSPTIVVGVFPVAEYPPTNFTEGVTVRLCTQRLSCNPGLAGLKHLNRLEQILSRTEWQDTSIIEGIMLDTNGNLIEAVFSNIFIVRNGELYTPDLSEAGVAGVMRRFIIETLAPQAGVKTHVVILGALDLFDADEVFLCNSLYGIWPVKKLIADNQQDFKSGAITHRLQNLVNKTLFA